MLKYVSKSLLRGIWGFWGTFGFGGPGLWFLLTTVVPSIVDDLFLVDNYGALHEITET